MSNDIDDPLNAELVQAAIRGDLEKVRALVAAGADVNARDRSGESVLVRVLEQVIPDADAYRLDVVRELLRLGADPCQLDEERGGPLTDAMLGMDTEMLRLLLDAGAQPNAESGTCDQETLYDWAVFDYCYEVWGLGELPEAPTEEERQSEGAWLL